MNIHKVSLDENEIQLLMNDPELRPEDTLKNLISKIFRKADKPLHIRDLENIVVGTGHFQAHNRKIPLKPSRSLTPILRESYGICKLSKGIYGLSEWQNVDSEVVLSEETDVAVQTAQQNSTKNNVEDSDNERKNCPKCGEKIDIKLNFCTSCGADLSGFCKNCLYQFQDHWIFCGNCGTNLKTEYRVNQ